MPRPKTRASTHSAAVTHDQRWMVISTSTGSEKGNAVGVAAIGKGDWTVRPLVTLLKDEWSLIDGIGDTLWFMTSKDGPRKQVVIVDLSGAEPAIMIVVPEDEAVLDSASIVGDKLVLNYLRDVKVNCALPIWTVSRPERWLFPA
jgi:prolyl oligopeptidase